jgi:hypothetical protein
MVFQPVRGAMQPCDLAAGPDGGRGIVAQRLSGGDGLGGSTI